MIGSRAFEDWARKRSMDLEYRNIPGVGQFYECPRTILALEAWQASRSSIVVELPTVCASDDPHELKRDIIEELQAQGITAS